MGTLDGLRVVEMEAIGPAPFCGMLLADMGADVVRIERAVRSDPLELREIFDRGRSTIEIDLKTPSGRDAALRLIDRADVLIEGFRPGVMERLGLAPDVCCARNPKLVYGRITGWGQTGPLAQAAGHDINYIALSGALHAIGTRDAPIVPLNLVGDFGGGGMLLAFGVLCAVLEARRSGRGQVVDAAMTEGAALLMAMTYALTARGRWKDERAANLLDGGAPFYATYRCADGEWIALGALEPQFLAVLLEKVGIADPRFRPPVDRALWPALREALCDAFARKPRDEWQILLEGTDACFAPVLALDEAPRHPHNAARTAFVERCGVTEPAPAPRFSRTPGEARPSRRLTPDEALGRWTSPSSSADRESR
jgi:alpha-methylacyl-CoA racemase